MLKISVFGTGYVGLANALCFADKGYHVTCYDVVADRVDVLKKAEVPFYEPNMEGLLKSHLSSGRLHFTKVASEAVRDANLIFIAVGTPSQEDGSADLGQVLGAARQIAAEMEDYKVILIKSTVPVGSCHRIKGLIQDKLTQRGVAIDFDVCSCPEFLSEGSAVKDALFPSRVVVGLDNMRALELLQQFFAPFLQGTDLVVMDTFSSEMTKYAANAMLAARISIMNELSRLCEKTGADIECVRKGIGSDPRIGSDFLQAGIGYGGSCLPKDVRGLIFTGQEHGEKLRILESVEEVNRQQRQDFFEKIYKYFQESLQGKKIVIWGVAFKPGTDDTRESPAIDLMARIVEAGGAVEAYDPMADHGRWNGNPYEILKGADALVVVTGWEEFLEPDFSKIKQNLKTPLIFDARNIYSPAKLKAQGFIYFSVGRIRE